MTDGAHQGVSPTRALQTILGGEPQPTAEEQLDFAAWRQRIEDAPDLETFNQADYEDSSEGYDQATFALAKAFLREIERDPTILTEVGRPRYPDDYSYPPMRGKFKELPDALYDKVVREARTDAEDADRYGYTGFMVGFATNAALRAYGLPPQENPAIVSLGRD